MLHANLNVYACVSNSSCFPSHAARVSPCRYHDAEPFTRWLLEEPDPEAPKGTPGAGGFVAFLAQVQGEAYDYMREQGWC